MSTSRLRFIAALAASVAATPLALPQAAATVVAASSAPARVAVAATGPASVSVSWRIVRQTIDPPAPGTVASPRLRFLIGAAVVAEVARPLARALPGDAISETTTITEVVQVPEALIFRAVKQGGTLRIERAFADGPGDTPQVAELQVTPSGPASVALGIDRLALSFDGEARTRVLPKGGALRVVAELDTSGVGLIAGQWEVASAVSSAGTPVFRPLSLVRQGVAGGGRAVITSPQLPAGAEGTHFVRFRVFEPAVAFAAPVLSYYVTPRAPGAAPAVPLEIIVAGPRPGEALTGATRFAWSALPGAEAYQVAFYATPAGPAEPLDPAGEPRAGEPAAETPLAGFFVAGDRSEAVAEAFTLARLPGDRSYLWRVLAFGANGAVVGSSPFREIHRPQAKP